MFKYSFWIQLIHLLRVSKALLFSWSFFALKKSKTGCQWYVEAGMQTGSCMNRRGYKVRANLRPAIFLLHWPAVRWGGRQILTQFANFGALALATTGQHERWPDYAVSVHNWHLLNMRYFPFYMNVKKFSSFTFTLGSAFYGEAPTNYVFFCQLLIQRSDGVQLSSPISIQW